jgi:hypothetical protein
MDLLAHDRLKICHRSPIADDESQNPTICNKKRPIAEKQNSGVEVKDIS